MALVENGRMQDGPNDPKAWLYNSVLEAVDDGSRVINFPTACAIWYRKGRSTTIGILNMFKYNYWRTAEPCRDWNVDSEFDCSWTTFHSEPQFEEFKAGIAAAEMFSWLAGEPYEHTGGQCWW